LTAFFRKNQTFSALFFREAFSAAGNVTRKRAEKGGFYAKKYAQFSTG